MAKIFEKAPCYQFFGLKASSRVLLGKEDSAGLDNIAREFASFSNSVMGFKLASFEEEATSVSRWLDTSLRCSRPLVLAKSAIGFRF